MIESISLNGTQLKLLAAVIMVIDHIGAVFFPQRIIFRIIGRIAFPIFCFMVAEGLYYTSDIRQYMMRLLVAGIITEPVYNLAFTGGWHYNHQNVMFTFLLAAVVALVVRNVKESQQIITIIAVILIVVLAEIISTDYGGYGVLLVVLFYMMRENKKIRIIASGFFQVAAASGIQQYSVFSLIPIAMYNGKPGKKIKYFFYLFYPGHLLIIFFVAKMLGVY